MLRAIRRSPPWHSTGYVCRACRHRLQASHRYQSSAVAAPETGGGEDDWYSNFNDLSATHDQASSSREDKGDDVPRSTVERQADREPQTRRLPAESAAIQRCAQQPAASLEKRLRHCRGQLKQIQEDVSKTEGTRTTAFMRPRSSDKEAVTKIESSIGLIERVLELRKTGVMIAPNREPRTRQLDPGHPAMLDLNRKSTNHVKEKLHRLRQVLQKSVVMPLERSTGPRAARATAFSRADSNKGPDEAKIRSQIGLLERFVELRERGELSEPDEVRERSKPLLLPTPEQSIEEMVAYVESLKASLATSTLQSVQSSSESSVAVVPAGVQESAFSRSSASYHRPYSIRMRIQDYERAIAQRRGGELPDSRSLSRKSSRILANSSENAAVTSGSKSMSHPLPSETTSTKQGADFEAVIAKLKQDLHEPDEAASNLGSTLDSLRNQLETETTGKLNAESSGTTRRRLTEPSRSHSDKGRASKLSATRSSVAHLPETSDQSFDSSHTRSSAPTTAEKVREAKTSSKPGGLALGKRNNDGVARKSPSGRKPKEEAEETRGMLAMLTDSPADLAEMQATSINPTISPKTKTEQKAKSRDPNLADLKNSLHLAIGKRDNAATEKQDKAPTGKQRVQDEERVKAIEQNIQGYQLPTAPSPEDNNAGVLDGASDSLAKLHRSLSVSAKEEDATRPSEKRPENTKEEADQNDQLKPAERGGRKRRQSVRAIKNPVSVTATGARSPNTTSDDGDSGEHRPLRNVMEESSPTVASAEDSRSAGADASPLDLPGHQPPSIASVKATDLHIDALDVPQPPVPGLEYGLDKVLFNPGVYQLQDPTSRVYNFDPYLEHIMPAVEFDFNALKEYKTSSEDKALSAIAKEHQKRYIGSTSSMTSTLAHFHYLLSNWRPLNLDMLSRGFTDNAVEFTRINRAPNSIFLRWKPESKTYAIDGDKEFDGANVLMMLGRSMEKMLTLPTSEFERYRKSDPREVSADLRDEPEAFQYTTMGDFLMRSQLDAQDSRLPGTGTFDLKTRAVLSVRMDAEDFEPMLGYELHTLQGRWNSYEREYYDMMRSTMLKYMLQARMGRMQGIFAAYHNIERIFGFQYIPMMDMDRAIHGQNDPCLGDQEFKLSLDMLNKVLNKATEKFPEKSLRILFETSQRNLGGDSPTPVMSVFAEPMAEKEIKRIQSLSKEKVREFERNVMGIADGGAKPAKPAKQEAAADTTESEDQPPTEYPPATPEPSGEEPESTEPEAEEDSVPTTYPPVTPEPPSSSSSNPNLSSSSSAADSDFLSSLVSSSSAAGSSAESTRTTSSSSTSNSDLAPLFAATLMTKSRINGEHADRPTRLEAKDDWTVEYLLTEYPESEATWARYVSAKARRKDVFAKERDDDEDVALDAKGEKKAKKNDGFIELLRAMAKRGRKYRKEMNAAAEGKEKKFAWKEAAPTASSTVGDAVASGSAVVPAVEDVGGYMEWLYEERGRKA